MKNLILALSIIVSLTWGCTPADTAPPTVEATPTAPGDEITEMNFESGEVEQSPTETEEPAAEAPQDIP